MLHKMDNVEGDSSPQFLSLTIHQEKVYLSLPTGQRPVELRIRPEYDKTIPTSPKAKALEGSYAGFQPKPAVEVIIVAMKPLNEKTFVEQAIINGKGVAWLDDCRIPYENEMDKEEHHYNAQGMDRLAKDYGEKLGTSFEGGWEKKTPDLNNTGRFPANLLVSDDVLAVESKGAISPVASGQKGFGGEIYGVYKSNGDDGRTFYSDKEASKSFSRYFSLDSWWNEKLKSLPESVQKTFPFLIVPKASKSEKNKGCENLPAKKMEFETTTRTNKETADKFGCERKSFMQNNHPTVKPVKLMSHLITLGSREGDLVLDPFMGSGTTAVACKQLGRNFIGFELNPEYVKMANERIKPFLEQQTLLERF